MDIKTLKIVEVIPNDYNPNVVSVDMMAKLMAEIAHKGLCEPIIVRQAGDAYTIVDGEHRWRICRDLGWQEIPCIVQDYDDKEAKIKTLQLNYLRGQAVPVRLAALIHDLNKEISLEDLARRLPYEEPHLLDSLELLKLPEDFGMAVERQAVEEAEQMPVVVSFVLSRRQAEVLEEAIQIAAETLSEGTKNRKAVALERICLDFIEQQAVKDEPELVAVSGKPA